MKDIIIKRRGAKRISEKLKIFHLFFLLLPLLFFACLNDDEILAEAGNPLTFSKDTLLFDTVFTELGSATRSLKVFNPNDKRISIDRIYIKGASGVEFRMNVDGIPGNDQKDIEIGPNDSIYIFAEVIIDPDQPLSISPFVVNDELIFERTGRQQTVVLEAWGQNANYIPNRFNKGQGILFTCDFNEFVWDDPKPYVIYGIIYIDECTLRIPAGTQVYVHGGLVRSFDQDSISFFFNDGRLIIGPNGNIVVEGTADQPVVFQGDRLEQEFDDIPGQWFGIILAPGSKSNRFEYAEIKNSAFGLAADSASAVLLKNTIIHNTAGNALIGIHSEITAENCLFYNNATDGVNLLYGGDYEFAYCTFASYGVDASAVSLSNAFCLDAPFCSEFRSNTLNAAFKNSIIFGTLKDEIFLFDRTEQEGDFNYSFDHCLIKVDELPETEPHTNFFDFCNACINGVSSDTIFVDPNEDNYHLDTLSIAEERAIPIPGITIDLEGKLRDAAKPDLGCYEFE